MRTGLTFQEVINSVAASYKEFVGTEEDTLEISEEIQEDINLILEAEDIEDLTNILDRLGFNKNEAYDFIFESIIF
jgi:hypothetical protein